MARLNIEDCWWTDPRRSKLIKLVGDECVADGCAVRMWRLAQEFWGRGRELIPVEVFETLEANAKLIEAKLAEPREGGIYVRGSSQYHDWVLERRNAAAKGGKKSAETRRIKREAATKKQDVTTTKRKQTQASSSISISSSVSISNSSSSSIGKEIVAAYCDAWCIRYGANPTIVGRDAKQLRVFAEEVGLAKAKNLVQAFLKLNDSWFLTKRHDIQTFLNNLGAVTQFLETGETLTKSDIRNSEISATNAQTLMALRQGGV